MEPISPLEYFSDAWQDVRRNASAALVFIIFSLLGSLVILAFQYMAPSGDAPPSAYWNLLGILSDLLHAALVSLGACIGLGRMGREIDRPLWKVRTDGDSVRIFLLAWFILIAGWRALLSLIAMGFNGADSPETGLFLILMICALSAWIIPIGACIMFHGRFEWAQLGEALAPLTRYFARTMLFIAFGFLTSLVFWFFIPSLSGALRPLALLVDAADSLCGCIVFAGIWEICRFDRNNPQEHDLDF